MNLIQPYNKVVFNDSWKSKVIQQLNKDLMLCGFDYEFDQSNSTEVFFKTCISFFEQLLLEDDTQLFNLLYRIDIPQNAISFPKETPQIHITKLILNREFQKVVLKSQYK